MGLGEEEAEVMLRVLSLENGEDEGDGGGLHEIWKERLSLRKSHLFLFCFFSSFKFS